ncbi:hypothetical protein O0L34_g6852 [Tuta absoluta]|nr:hypothetical protein O0L34_g6852 [Tuta absoluta]
MAVHTTNTALSPRQAFNGQRVRRIPGCDIKIATWNVQSMFKLEKQRNIELEMKRLNIDILGISESRLKGSGIEDLGDTVLYYSGKDDRKHQYGVALMIKKELKSAVLNYLPVSDRVMLLQLRARPININILQVYAPTTGHSDTITDNFYEEVGQTMTKLKKGDCTIVLGDFNSKVGEGTVQDIVDGYGLGVRNDRGDRLVQFCQEEQLVVTNTYFKLPPRRLYTWTSPAHSPTHIVRNQIDYILVSKRFRNSFKSVKTYPGADVGSDHNVLVAAVSIRLKKLIPPKNRPGIDVSRLREEKIRELFHDQLNCNFQELQMCDTELSERPTKTWADLRDVLVETSKEILKPLTTVKKKDWVSHEILDLMTKRREMKGQDSKKYKELHKEIHHKCITAKDNWVCDICSEMETLEKKHDYFNLYKKIKMFLGNKKSITPHTLIDNNGRIMMTTQEKLKLWEEYIEALFHDTRSVIFEESSEHTGPPITKSEISYAIKCAKTRKAVGPDEIPSEVFKHIDYDNLDIVVQLFNEIYNTGCIPIDWLKSTFVTLPKISNAKKCSDFRTISLMSHMLKIFLKIIHSRIHTKIEDKISDTQFGFRNGLGTRDALFGYQVLMQRCWDMNQTVYICFIDYEKAFDRVQHQKLIEILHNTGIDSKDIRIIRNLYWQQTANVRVEQALSNDVKILRGVRQGCILSPILFNIYAETIFSEALEDAVEGVVINGQHLSNIRYADDTIILATTLEDLQNLVDRVESISAAYGLNINTKKTKFMMVGRIPQTNRSILKVRGQPLERVQSYKYLGCIVNEQSDHSIEIKCRIEQARSAFVKMSDLLCNRSLQVSTRVRLARCYVFSILLYGSEAWTLTEAMAKRIQAFEMWVYRRMLRISWTDKVRNDIVLQRMNKKLEVLNTIKRRKLEYFGHIMRNEKYKLLQLIIQGKIQGRRLPGRRKISWLKNLREWYGMSTRSLFRAAVDKVKIAMMIANLR